MTGWRIYVALVCCLLVSLPAPLRAAASVLDAAAAGSSDGGSVDVVINSLGASAICVWQTELTGSLSTPTDAIGGAYVPQTPVVGDIINGQWSCDFTPATSATHTISVGGGFPSMCAMALGGTSGAALEDESGDAELGVDSIQPGAVVPTVNGSLVLIGGGLGAGAATVTGIGSGFTVDDQEPFVDGEHWGSFCGHLVQTTAASVNPTVSLDDFPSETIAALAVLAPASGRACRGRLTLLGVGC